MEFSHTQATEERIAVLEEFMEAKVAPRDAEYRKLAGEGAFPIEIVEALKREARELGLWNLFLPTLPDDAPGQRLTNLEYAPLAEIMGRIPWSSEVFNCQPPDAVNMEILSIFATPSQRRAFLEPLLEGKIRSSVGMAERDAPGSDMTSVETTVVRDGDELVLNGRKWFVNGALHPNFAFATVYAREVDPPSSDPGRQHSWIIVPASTEGFVIEGHLPIMNQPWPQGYCDVRLEDVRLSAENLVGEPGGGIAVAQALMGPALVHHCARSIGQCELALALMCERARERTIGGVPLSDRANVREWIAQSRLEIDQVRLVVQKACWLMDTHGNPAAAKEISLAKVAAARMQTAILDRAIQVLGALGLTPESPLAYLWTWGRALRIIDGSDEAHLEELARQELAREPEAVLALGSVGYD